LNAFVSSFAPQINEYDTQYERFLNTLAPFYECALASVLFAELPVACGVALYDAVAGTHLQNRVAAVSLLFKNDALKVAQRRRLEAYPCPKPTNRSLISCSLKPASSSHGTRNCMCQRS